MPAKWGGGTCVLEELAAEDVSDSSVEAIGDQIQELFCHRNRLDAEIQRRLHRFDKARGDSADGVLTTRAWLRWKCHLSASEATERVEVARRLGGLEITASAFAEGAITFRHAALIARTSREVGEKWEAHAEDILVTAAREVDTRGACRSRPNT